MTWAKQTKQKIYIKQNQLINLLYIQYNNYEVKKWSRKVIKNPQKKNKQTKNYINI